MRYQGKITVWNEARGFGFIEWNGGNDKVFVHISAFSEKQQRPVVGDIVTYEVTKDEKGRHNAAKVAFPKSASKKNNVIKSTASIPWRGMATLAILVAVGIGAFQHYKPRETFTSSAFSAEPAAAVESNFSCEGKTHCSQMTSCEEATFYLNNCPGTEVDGDGDRVPCESQWCI